MVAFLQGFGIGAGLIIAIGAQNSFVLSQGIKKQHVFLIPLLCSICDASLIFLGAAGTGAFIASRPGFAEYAGMEGAIFLFWYGLKSLFAALAKSSLKNSQASIEPTISVVLTTLALTLFNPHVYIDTIVMLGSISGRFDAVTRYIFALGASSASCLWFFSLRYGGSLLERFFRNPVAWKVLDFCICLVMWTIVTSLWPVSIKN